MACVLYVLCFIRPVRYMTCVYPACVLYGLCLVWPVRYMSPCFIRPVRYMTCVLSGLCVIQPAVAYKEQGREGDGDRLGMSGGWPLLERSDQNEHRDGRSQSNNIPLGSCLVLEDANAKVNSILIMVFQIIPCPWEFMLWLSACK